MRYGSEVIPLLTEYGTGAVQAYYRYGEAAFASGVPSGPPQRHRQEDTARGARRCVQALTFKQHRMHVDGAFQLVRILDASGTAGLSFIPTVLLARLDDPSLETCAVPRNPSPSGSS